MGIGMVETKVGKLSGVVKQGYAVFRGVPYAEPPVGELRFRRAIPVKPWDGVREAKSFGARCMQRERQPGTFYYKEFFEDEDFVPPMREDSLFLNIWTPAESADEGLPVAFWIHGGAFTGGFSGEMEFDGAEYARRGVILVTVNYRLGALGFLAHPELTKEDGASGNYGLYDQLTALSWVRENITFFGGDPNRITIFGQSAGCMSVQTLISSPLTKGMISGAILQSAGGYGAGFNRDTTLADAEAMGEDFVRFAGVNGIAALREMPEEKIQVLSDAFFAECMKNRPREGLPFKPCIDGRLLTDGYDAIVDQALHHDIPYMIGSTKNDIGATKDGEFSPLYRGCIAWSLRNEALFDRPSYVYYFTRAPLGDDAGAFHSSELWYMFGTLSRSWRPKEYADYDLSDRMMEYWCNFMRHGNPNADELEEWIPCTKESPYVMVLDIDA